MFSTKLFGRITFSRLRLGANNGAISASLNPAIRSIIDADNKVDITDATVNYSVKPHKFFERDGTTVLCEVPINIVQATLGADIKVPTLDGQVTMKVPEGTQPGKVLRLKGKGIPSLRGGSRGDQLVRIKVVVPTKLSDKQKDALRKFADISKDNINPEEKSFMDKVKDFFK